MSTSERQAESILTIDLGAIVDNWRRLSALGGGAVCAAVVDDIAWAAGTIGYEILTRPGSRFERRYPPQPARAR